jgi:hypothetical protein
VSPLLVLLRTVSVYSTSTVLCTAGWPAYYVRDEAVALFGVGVGVVVGGVGVCVLTDSQQGRVNNQLTT